MHQHKSEHDLYGSKLSTRMQDSAKSAWKASKNFAGSVITGRAVGISACRKQRGSHSSENSNSNKLPNQQLQPEVCQSPDQFREIQVNGSDLASVIKVESSPNLQSGAGATQSQHVIRLGESNNKLTIVTKFNDSPDGQRLSAAASIASPSASSSPSEDCSSASQQPSSANPSSNSTGSERSRCESSSSGRGTSASDSGSTSASQNGDDAPPEVAATTLTLVNSSQAPSQIANQQQQQQPQQQQVAKDDNNNNCDETSTMKKQHRRKSSLFKASKVFGSQMSLNKLRTFLFTTNGKATINSDGARSTQEPEMDARLVAEQHLENSRLRCMELNRAINQPAKPDACESALDRADSQADKAAEEVGQGELSSAAETDVATAVAKQEQQQQQGQKQLAIGSC